MSVLGVDVHAAYGSIVWDRVAKAGVRFAIVKCTAGNDPLSDDRAFARNVVGAKAAGIITGGYMFGYPLPSGPGRPAGRSPKEQAERFFRVSKGLGAEPGELPPTLDFEWPPRWGRRFFIDENGNGVRDPGEPLIDQWKRWGVDATFLCEWALECLEHIERLWGVVPIVYEYPDWRVNLGPSGKASEWTSYPLWIATYPESAKNEVIPPPTARPILHPPWEEWAIWQFSADGSPMRIDGIPVAPIDRNVMRDEATLRRLARLDAPAASTPSTPIGDFDVVHPDVPLEKNKLEP